MIRGIIHRIFQPPSLYVVLILEIEDFPAVAEQFTERVVPWGRAHQWDTVIIAPIRWVHTVQGWMFLISSADHMPLAPAGQTVSFI